MTRHGEDEVGAGSSGELGLGAEQTAEGDEQAGLAAVLEQRRKRWDD